MSPEIENKDSAISNKTESPEYKKAIVGLTEKIFIKGEKENAELIARIDTGATKSSIDIMLASKLGLGPIIDSRLIKSAHGTKLRPIVHAEVIIKGKTIKAKFTVADRVHMRYQVLIGQNVLRKEFLVDPSLRADLPEKRKIDDKKEGENLK
jgi:hypothetical protein